MCVNENDSEPGLTASCQQLIDLAYTYDRESVSRD